MGDDGADDDVVEIVTRCCYLVLYVYVCVCVCVLYVPSPLDMAAESDTVKIWVGFYFFKPRLQNDITLRCQRTDRVQ